MMGAQWLSGRVLDLRPKGREFEPHRRHSVVSLNENINPSLVLIQPRKTRPFITERLLMGRKESNQTNKTNKTENEFEIFENHPLMKNNHFKRLNIKKWMFYCCGLVVHKLTVQTEYVKTNTNRNTVIYLTIYIVILCSALFL